MSDDRIYQTLMDISAKLGSLEASQKTTADDVKDIKGRLDSIEKKPVRRLEGGITTAIATVVATVVSTVINQFTRK